MLTAADQIRLMLTIVIALFKSRHVAGFLSFNCDVVLPSLHPHHHHQFVVYTYVCCFFTEQD
jgi:hypothetical protein